MTERLTTLAAVKELLNINSNDSDDRLIQIIDAVSQFILAYTSIPSFRRTQYTQNFKGTGKASALLRAWPVLSVTTVATGGTLVPASSFTNYMPSSGYYLSDPRYGMQSIEMVGYAFLQGVPSTVIYESGWETSQSGNIPDASPYTVTPTESGTWSQDLGVTINGAAATPVAADPAAGEYSVGEWGEYTFSADDAGAAYVISYSYTPPAVSLAAQQIVAEWFKKKDRIGLLSKTLGGQETITFSTADMDAASKSMLQPFVNVAPV